MCHSPSHYGVFCRSTSPGLTPMALYDFIWTRKKCKYSCLCWHHRRVHLHALILLFFPVGQGLSDLACLFPEHLPGWTHFGLSHPYGWLVQRDAPRRRKPPAGVYRSQHSPGSGLVALFGAPVEGGRPPVHGFLQEPTLACVSLLPSLSVSPSSPHGRCCGLIWLHRKTAVIQQTPREIWWQMGPDPGKLLSAQIEISFSLLLAEMK